VKVASSASVNEEKWAQRIASTGGGKALTCSLISVMKAYVPSEPDNNLQKLKGSPSGVKASERRSKSMAYPVFRL
ncbi:MAG: hypothetical protein ACK55I_18635, partial [bacterium]